MTANQTIDLRGFLVAARYNLWAIDPRNEFTVGAHFGTRLSTDRGINPTTLEWQSTHVRTVRFLVVVQPPGRA